MKRLRWVALLVVVGLVALDVAVTVHGAGRRNAPSYDPVAPLAVGTAMDRPLPRVPLIDERGRPTSLSAFRGRYVVLAPALTLCHETCPLTTGALLRLRHELRAGDLARRVTLLEATVDPWRDRPARLRAFERRTGSNLRFLTGTVAQIRRLWQTFGVGFRRIPQGPRSDIDWWTHRREHFDVAHTEGVFILDPSGHERVAVLGMADVGGRLPVRLDSLLNATGRQNLRHPQAAWTAEGIAQDMRHLMRVPTPRSGGRLAGGPSLARRRLEALRGRPVVVNAWASWCPPCQREFPLLANADAKFGWGVAFMGLDVNDQPASARRFLSRHTTGYPSYSDPRADVAHSLAPFAALPTTFFLDAAGKVSFVHVGEYTTKTALADDIRRYAFPRESGAGS